MSEKEKNKVFNTIGLSPSISMPAKGDANSTTKASVAQGTIDIRENPTQDISSLSRDTEHALNELGRIFDKEKIEEQQELARVFGEEAFRLAHNLPDDGSGRKIAVHAIIGGIMSQITGAGFASGAIGAGVNEAIIGEIKKIKDPGTAQIVSAIVGAAATKAVGGNAGAGATAAASGTKNNLLTKAQFLEKERRLQAANTEAEKEAIEQEYRRLDKEKDRQDDEEEERLTKEGILSPNEIADIINKKNTDYVAFDGLPQIRLGRISVTPADMRNPLIDGAAGFVVAVDNNMSFGLGQGIYQGLTGRRIDNRNTPTYHLFKIIGDSVTGGIGSWGVGAGISMGAGGLIAAPETGGLSLSISAEGATLAGYGLVVTKNSLDNMQKDTRQFIESLDNGARPELKGGDKTPSGAELSYHAADQANERKFTLKNIDDIILNNRKKRTKEIQPDGEIRWRYQDQRGNTVITDEWGKRVITVYSHPASKNNKRYIPKE